MRKLLFTVCFIGTCSSILGQRVLPLWSKVVPNSKITDEEEIYTPKEIIVYRKVQEGSLEVFLPAPKNATGKAVVICPGGAYHGSAYDWEGTDFAKWFNAKGIAAFVLKYRFPQSHSVIDGSMAPLQDAQRAIRLVRTNAAEWNIDQNKIGIMGFSAGGHLASTLGTHHQDIIYETTDDIDKASPKPNFMILVYPVISMYSAYTHQGSKDNLVGKNPTKEKIKYFSSELNVSASTPPTFLVHAADDMPVPSNNSILFFQALQKAKVYSEMHIYPVGGHGFGLGLGEQHLETWTDRLYDWMQSLDTL